ncbi:MAG: hypothetical protein ACLR5G_08620 [Eubacteriales bacterium]
MREDIYYVGSPSGDTPFRICIAGISYCDGSYRIRRTDSDVMSIEYIYDGSGTVEYGGHTYHPEKDDVYMVLRRGSGLLFRREDAVEEDMVQRLRSAHKRADRRLRAD